MEIIVFLLIIVGIILYLHFNKKYFSSNEFIQFKNNLQKDFDNIKDFNSYMSNLFSTFSEVKRSEYGQTSAKNVCDCSLTVLRNAKNSPFTYICKYFNITKTDETLNTFENLLNQTVSIEQGQESLLTNKEKMLEVIKTQKPWYVTTSKFLKELNFPDIQIANIEYPSYTFSYRSPGGNKNDSFTVIFDSETIEKFVLYLSEELSHKKKAQRERSLMTKSLRESIKKRDNYTCQNCGNSIFNEPNLLLEIDHIIPIAKGGTSTPENLQTLCWKCNRVKGAK